MTLLAQHQKLIDESAIAPEVAEARGYQSAQTKAEIGRLGFSRSQLLAPALVIPLHTVSGKVGNYHLRPDRPRIRDGKPVKYETPAGSHLILDVPPTVRAQLSDTEVPLLITEGARKADSAVSLGLCCVAIMGTWCGLRKDEAGHKHLLPDFDAVALEGRLVYVVFDSDVMEKKSVHQALEAFVPLLAERGAEVRVIYLPPTADGEKVGLDDFLAAGHGAEELLALAERDLRPLTGTAIERTEYAATDEGLVWNQPPGNTPAPAMLTNFVAVIVSDVVRDDGAEQSRLFEIETELRGRKASFRVPASEFDSLGWVNESVGAGAIVAPGYIYKEHARVAIKVLSGDVPQQILYAHLGWTEIDGAWVYLHSAGAIGADGLSEDVRVAADDCLAGFELPVPPDGRELEDAITASLLILHVAPLMVTVPVLAAVYRVPLGPCTQGLHLTGGSGVGKSTFAALAQQHFGAAMNADHLPVAWTSTQNYIEGALYAAKDALVVVDDLVLGDSRRDVEEAYRKADRVYRAQANQQGRGRMDRTAGLRPTKYPRGLTLGTSEDLPGGQSLRARLQIIEFKPDTLDFDRVTPLQRLASEGVLAQAMAGYLQWLAPGYGATHSELKRRITNLREQAYDSRHHRRTPDTVASLMVGFESLLEYAREVGALSGVESDELREEAWNALGAAAEAQLPHQADADHVSRFLSLLGSAINGGHAHLADVQTGSHPRDPARWGWAESPVPQGERNWRSQGKCVGWIDSDDLLLDLDLALGAAQQVARDLGQYLGITPPVLAGRLADRGYLLSTEQETRGTYKVRRTINGKRANVLHLSLTVLGHPDASDPTHPTSHPTTASSVETGLDDASGRAGRVPPSSTPIQGDSESIPALRPDGTGPPPGSDQPDQPDQRVDCPYPSHRARGTDWITDQGGRVCGICHPPATPSLLLPGEGGRSPYATDD